jgi:autophagy-related protein 11
MPTSALPVEVEDKFHVSNSHPFPARGRSNSSPAARPSSLSRLLAQASPHDAPSYQPLTTEEPRDVKDAPSMPDPEPAEPSVVDPSIASSVPEAAVVSPPIDPQALAQPISPPPRSPSQFTDSLPRHLATGQPSPLRPGSRASRLSSTSRFSLGRKPTLGVVASGGPSKATATVAVALADQHVPESPSTSNDGNPFVSPITPSPDESISEALANAMEPSGDRRRSTSRHVARAPPLTAASSQSTAHQQPIRPTPTTATSTLASLASSWGVPFGRKRRSEPVNRSSSSTIGPVPGTSTERNGPEGTDGAHSRQPSTSTDPTSARELLQQF